MPASPSGLLRDLAESVGWLGDPATGDVSSWTTYAGDRAAATWLPSQEAAEQWQDFVDIQREPGPGGTYPDVSGVYDLTAVVTNSNGWGYEGWQFTSELTIDHSTDRPRFGGTFDSARWVDPDGQSEEGRSGGVSGSIDAGGHLIMELLIEGNQYASWYQGTLADGRIEGSVPGRRGRRDFRRRAQANALTQPKGRSICDRFVHHACRHGMRTRTRPSQPESQTCSAEIFTPRCSP